VTPTRTLVILASSLLSTAAFAGTVGVTPLLKDGVDDKTVVNIHQLLTSEIDFMPMVDGMTELDNYPASLNTSCLGSASCLGRIAAETGTDQLVTGIIHSRGTDFGLDLVLYDANEGRIVRRKEFHAPADPTELANGMTPIVKELLTGHDPKAAAAAAPVAATFDAGSAGDDFVFEEDIGDDPFAEAPPAAAPVVAVAPIPAPAPAPVTDADAMAMISFGGSAEQITAEEVNSIQFGAPTSAPPPIAAAPAPMPVAAAPAPASTGSVQNLDEEKGKGGGNGGGNDDRQVNILQVTVRGGYAKYYAFDFITVGAEVGVPVIAGLNAIAGVEAYNVQRLLPPDLQAETGQFSEWNTIFPLNVGVMYKFLHGIVQPYAGADMIFVQYYSDDIGSDWAAGGRVRAGMDAMIVKNFGVNVNVGFGAWSGKNWGLIEQGVGPSGPLPQISAGTVLAF
jgi:hypothetical protein